MKHQQNLQVNLRERLRRLLMSHSNEAGHEVRLTVEWINKQVVLTALLTEASQAEPELDYGAFEAALGGSRGSVPWTSRTEDGRAILTWKLMQRIADLESSGNSERVIAGYALNVAFGTRNITDAWREFAQRVLEPLFNYLHERLSGESAVLYVLGRYIRRLEWFDRDTLYERAMADTRKIEDVYDSDLRRFLFDEGISMPFSQTRSASGESDILSDLDGDDPLVCELKVFDNENRDKRHVGSGLHQAIQYAEDFGKSMAYLVIVNISGRPLELPTDGAEKVWPPFLETGGVRVNLITVRAKPMPTASKLGKAKPINFSRQNFIDPDLTS